MANDDLTKKNDVFSEITSRNENLVPISRSIVRELKRQQRRTGLTGYALLQVLKDIPEGLTGDGINAWFTIYNGPVLRAPPDHIDFVVKGYEKQPDVKKRWRKEKRVPITPEFLKGLEYEFDRTGITLADVFSRNFDCPDGLSYAIVGSWRRGVIKQAFPSYMKVIMRYLRSLPDKDG